jgi:hypothetical protein
VIGWGFLAWTIAFGLWWGPTAYTWWRDYRDVVAWQVTGEPPLPSRGTSFLQDLPFKVAIALGILGFGYVVIAALAGICAVARRHADIVLGPASGDVRR